jgi:uncharacterized cupin superfamily protein
MTAINLFTAQTPNGRIDVARELGSSELAMFVYDVQPGRSSSPYHYEYEDEWLLVVEGSVAVRTPDGELQLERGAHERPAGPAGAHKVLNRGERAARTLLFSNARTPAVSVYPDGDTVGVWTDDDDLVFERGKAVPWAHGEEGWHLAS